jgi:hypothetical protein
LVSALNRFNVSWSSTEIPTTCPPFSSTLAYRSRYALVCFVQPDVKAFGKKNRIAGPFSSIVERVNW